MVQITSYRQFNLSCAESWTTHLYFVRAWTSSVTDKNSAAGVVRVHSFYRWNISNNRTVCYENDDGERQQMLLVRGKTLLNFWRSETFYKDLVFCRQLNNAKYKPHCYRIPARKQSWKNQRTALAINETQWRINKIQFALFTWAYPMKNSSLLVMLSSGKTCSGPFFSINAL